MNSENTPTKFDDDKPEQHLLPSLALEEIGRVMSLGGKKYGEYNWAQGEGINWSRYFNACLRHLWSYWRGSNLDEETKKSHLAHAGACILILLEMSILKKGKDNRPIYYKTINSD